jgi:hypothetical protein
VRCMPEVASLSLRLSDQSGHGRPFERKSSRSERRENKSG